MLPGAAVEAKRGKETHGVTGCAPAFAVVPSCKGSVADAVPLGALGPRGLALTGRLADGWIPFLPFAGPDRIPEMLDRIRTAAVAANRPTDAVRAVYSFPVRLDPKARSTANVIAGSAADVIEQLHSFTELGFTGFDLVPRRDQIRALAEDVVPALREMVPSTAAVMSGSPRVTLVGAQSS